MHGKDINRVREYDILRVLLSILVVFGHGMYLSFETVNGKMDYNFVTQNLTETTSRFWDLFNYFLTWIYSFHMPMFFMLSGAVFCLYRERYGSFRILFKEKLYKLIFPYFLVGLFYMIPIKFIVGFYDFNFKELILVYASYFSFNLSESGQLWFLPALFFMFILFYLFNKMYIQAEGKNSNIQKIMVITLCIILFFIYKKQYDIVFFMKFSQNFRLDFYFIYFSIGYFFELYRVRVNSYLNGNGVSNIILVVSLFVSMVNIQFLNVNPNFELTIFPMIFMYVLSYKLVNSVEIYQSKIYRYFSKKVYDIYLFHDPINFLVIYLSYKLFHFNFLSSVVGVSFYFLVRTGINAAICIGISSFYDKYIFHSMKKIRILENKYLGFIVVGFIIIVFNIKIILF